MIEQTLTLAEIRNPTQRNFSQSVLWAKQMTMQDMKEADTALLPSPFRRRELLLMGSGLLMLVVCVVLDGIVNRQTGDPDYIAQAASRIESIPATIGDWESVEGTIDERERRLAEIVGAVRREYRNRNTGFSVTLTVLSGKAGPMTVHPPTACFQGVGYALRTPPSVTTLRDTDGQVSELNRASFSRSENHLSEVVRVFWGWSTEGNWEAPANPRLSLRGRPGLFKLYVVDRSTSVSDDLHQAEAFMEEALPVIRAALSSDSHGVTTKSQDDQTTTVSRLHLS